VLAAGEHHPQNCEVSAANEQDCGKLKPLKTIEETY